MEPQPWQATEGQRHTRRLTAFVIVAAGSSTLAVWLLVRAPLTSPCSAILSDLVRAQWGTGFMHLVAGIAFALPFGIWGRWKRQGRASVIAAVLVALGLMSAVLAINNWTCEGRVGLMGL